MMLMPLLRVTRPVQTFLLTCPYLATLYYLRAGAMRAGWQTDLLSAASLALVLAGGYAINDAADVRYDRTRANPGPVAAGEVSGGRAAAVGVSLAAAGCLLGIIAAKPGFAICLIVVAAALLAYDLVSKRIGLWKEVVVGLLMSSTYVLAAGQVGGFDERAATVRFFALWMFLSTIAYEIYSDVRDRRSDRQGGGGPAVIQAHPGRWMRMGDGLMVAGALALVGPAMFGCGSVYRLAAPLLVGGPLLGCVRARRPGSKMLWVFVQFLGVGVATMADVAILV